MYIKIKKSYPTYKRLPKVFTIVSISETIKNQLILLGVFKGEYNKKTHFSHIPYLIGLKNKYVFYNIDKGILLFSHAFCFLKKSSINPNTKFVLTGTPLGQNHNQTFFSRYTKFNHRFFPNQEWEPGYISKQSTTKNIILIIYDLNLNFNAYHEGINAKIPIVGFVTPSCDIRGLDYPVLFNLKNYSTLYLKLLLSLFYTNE